MANKITAHKAKSTSPAMNHGAPSQGKGKASGSANRSANRGVQGQGKSKGSGSAGGSWNKVLGAGMTAGNKTKDGCFPKVLTLFVSFIAIGAIFLLRS